MNGTSSRPVLSGNGHVRETALTMPSEVPGPATAVAGEVTRSSTGGEREVHKPYGKHPLKTYPLKPLVRTGLPRTTSHSQGVGGAVTGEELQSALLLVLALYASMAVLNLRAELSALVQHWHSFVEFLASVVLPML